MLGRVHKAHHVYGVNMGPTPDSLFHLSSQIGRYGAGKRESSTRRHIHSADSHRIRGLCAE